MYQYNPQLRKFMNLSGSILFSVLESEFTDRSHLELSKRELRDRLQFTDAEINSAFKVLVKQYKSLSEYKDSKDKFDGYLYCSYIKQGRGASHTYIFRNNELVHELLRSIELTNRKSPFVSSTRLSIRETTKMPETFTGQEVEFNSESLRSIELTNRKSSIVSFTRLSTGEMPETIVESHPKPLQSIELTNGKSSIVSSTRLSTGKGHPYRDINNNIYILSLEESERVEQMNQESQEFKTTPPTPPPLVRAVDPLKATEKSHGSDPWMLSSNNPKPEFAKWLWEKNKLKRETASLADAKAEIRNNWIRAQDLWDDYQSELTAKQKPKVADKPMPDLPPASDSTFDPLAFRQKLAQKINQLEN